MTVRDAALCALSAQLQVSPLSAIYANRERSATAHGAAVNSVHTATDSMVHSCSGAAAQVMRQLLQRARINAARLQPAASSDHIHTGPARSCLATHHHTLRTLTHYTDRCNAQRYCCWRHATVQLALDSLRQLAWKLQRCTVSHSSLPDIRLLLLQ